MTSQQFLQALPEKVAPEALDGMETNFHFQIDDQDITVEVRDGQVEVREGLHGEPTCVVKAKDENFMKIIEGRLNPMMAILTGKLKISNQGEMIKYAKIFGLM